MRVTKTDPGGHAYKWFQSLPSLNRPMNCELVNNELLSYDFIEGTHPRNWQYLHEVAAQVIWGVHPPMCDTLEIDRTRYCAYMYNCAAALKMRPPERAIHRIMTEPLTPVLKCHGDLTFANVILTREGNYVFIDPGDDRGLPCRELDESKIMQSLDGFDVIYRNWEDPSGYPRFPARRVHWALLVTHYYRLLRHVSFEPALAFARDRINDIEEML